MNSRGSDWIGFDRQSILIKPKHKRQKGTTNKDGNDYPQISPISQIIG
jgi:hypothetical protein